MSLFAIFERRRDEAIDPWFERIAARMLGSWRLVAGGEAHRLVEIELYYHGPDHEDPFAHAHPIQLDGGRWYFHRIGGSYRGGSFKGVDLTFGDGVATGGVLLRSIETPAGELVVGPSLCVDHLLRATRAPSVAALDASIAGRLASDARSPLHLVSVAEGAGPEKPIFRSRRVGLTLKRHNDALAIDRIARAYRFLTEPRRVTKGRAELIDALLAEGRSPAEIRALTGSPLHAIVARARAR